MTVVIDAKRRAIRAGVSDLLGEPEQRSIGLTGSGLSRLWIGSELHRRLQRDLEVTEPGFASEVPTDLELEVDGWTVEISAAPTGSSLTMNGRFGSTRSRPSTSRSTSTTSTPRNDSSVSSARPRSTPDALRRG